ncbi:unnamed protein product [Rotaria sordida]|uniref:Uncharacterized protein n=1 Tax=Rotaria sordida TaxID=392033 RepID=A0A819L569_9BILA|nr:unnamed protein product [Rotaria sordida]
MGTCTSTARHRQKQRPQEYNRAASKNSIVLDLKSPPPLSSLPLNIVPNHQYQHSYCLSTDFDLLSSTKPFFHQTDTNSLIQLYSSNTNSNNNNNNNNNNSNIISRMSSASSVPQVPPRIPVPKTRLPAYHPPQSQQTTITIRPKNVTSTAISTNQTGSITPMSITNRPPPPTTMQTRFGFIPRPTAPGLPQSRASTYASRSRSISPTSNVSANSSSSSSISSQRLAKAPTISKPTPNRSIPSSTTTTTTTNSNTSKAKILTSPRHGDSSITKPNVKSNIQAPTAASRMRSRTPSRTSATSSSSSIASPPPPPSSAPSSSSQSATTTTTTTTTIIKTDVNTIRDRYKTQKRMNFFTRRTPLSTANGSPVASSISSPETLVINQENKQSSSISKTTNNRKNDSKAIIPPEIPLSHQNDSTYGNVKSTSNQPPSAHLSQGNRHRQRAISMLSGSSAISDVLNQDTLLEDDNCSLKSDDLICDYDDTVTIKSTCKNDRIDSLPSSSIEPNKQHTKIMSVTPTKPNIPHYQPTSKEHRSTTTTKYSTTLSDTINASLRESLDELNRLSNQMDHNIDNEQNRRLMTRSVSLKPPSSYLPRLEDAEQITMDIESYRQVMKDVMVVKTILHQLDRLLKHSDGANMTDSMVGSFHEYHDPMFSSRRYSTSLADGNVRNLIDENSSYDDLLKEITTLRKEKEQDKQTIKLLQEQMYKYSSQTNG